MEPEFELFVVAAPGLEAVCVAELATLGLAGELQPGGVSCRGSRDDLMRANLALRSASRVLVRLGEVGARDFPALFKACVKLPWGRFVRPARAVVVRASSSRSRLNHTGRIAETVTAAIDRALGRAPCPPGDDPQLVLARFEADRCTLSLDSSGELLHRRGYRLEPGAAPLRETLAAGLLAALGWDGQIPLCDPLCGSGTLLIEAALRARRLPPGGERGFAFMHWPHHRPGRLALLRQELLAPALPAVPVPLRGFDIAPAVIEQARRNAARAGVAAAIEFAVSPLAALPPVAGPAGLLLTNPPYGERLGASAALRGLYHELGEAARTRLPGWRVALVCPDPALVRATGLPLGFLGSFDNGGRRVGLYATPARA